MSYTLVNQLSVAPINCNVGYNNSWLEVKNNASRELFAQASYITNFDDLSITLSAETINVNLQDVESLIEISNESLGTISGKLDITHSQINALNTKVDILTGYGINYGETSDITNFSSTSQAEIKAGNFKRIAIVIYNEGPGNLYIRYGSGTVSTSVFSLKIAPSAYIENTNYKGIVRGLFDAVSSRAQVTQILST